MPPDSEQLRRGAEALGVPLDARQSEQLAAYGDLISKWNRVYNLTSLRERERMVSHHLLDSMTVVAPLRRMQPQLQSVLDVGSGGGFPGAVIAILLPGIDVTCVDTVAKKAAFVQQAASELRLANLRGMHARVETLCGVEPDVIVSRAFASLADFVSLTRHLTTPASQWLAMKGAYPASEIAALPRDIEMFHVERAGLPGENAERHLVWMRMRASASPRETPEKSPTGGPAS